MFKGGMQKKWMINSNMPEILYNYIPKKKIRIIDRPNNLPKYIHIKNFMYNDENYILVKYYGCYTHINFKNFYNKDTNSNVKSNLTVIYFSDEEIVIIIDNTGKMVKLSAKYSYIKKSLQNDIKGTKYKLKNDNINLISINSKNTICCQLSGICSKLEELNKKLQEKCEGLSITVNDIDGSINKNIRNENYQYNLIDSDFIRVCLNYVDSCVAKIDISTYTSHMGELIIDSYTHTDYRGRKYNTFLRAIVIVLIPFMICPLKIDKLTSFAINPISAWLLIKYFGGHVDETEKNMDKFVQYRKNHKDNDLRDIIFEYISHLGHLIIIVDINADNLALAQNVFDELLKSSSGFIC